MSKGSHRMRSSSSSEPPNNPGLYWWQADPWKGFVLVAVVKRRNSLVARPLTAHPGYAAILCRAQRFTDVRDAGWGGVWVTCKAPYVGIRWDIHETEGRMKST